MLKYSVVVVLLNRGHDCVVAPVISGLVESTFHLPAL